MAAPNIVNTGNIFGKTYGNVLNTSNYVQVANPAASGNVLKINSIMISNVYAGGAANASVEYNTTATGTGAVTRLISAVSIPAQASLILVDKSTSFYLEENTSIKGFASSNSNCEIIISYEVISL